MVSPSVIFVTLPEKQSALPIHFEVDDSMDGGAIVLESICNFSEIISVTSDIGICTLTFSVF